MRIPIITQYLSVLSVHDETGHILDMQDRDRATLIFPLKGRIRVSAGERVTLADGAHPIYLSRGACYRNECLEEAHSIMFNFQDDIAPGTIESLPPAPAGAVAEAYLEHTKSAGRRLRPCADFVLPLPAAAPGAEQRIARKRRSPRAGPGDDALPLLRKRPDAG